MLSPCLRHSLVPSSTQPASPKQTCYRRAPLRSLFCPLLPAQLLPLPLCKHLCWFTCIYKLTCHVAPDRRVFFVFLCGDWVSSRFVEYMFHLSRRIIFYFIILTCQMDTLDLLTVLRWQLSLLVDQARREQDYFVLPVLCGALSRPLRASARHDRSICILSH